MLLLFRGFFKLRQTFSSTSKSEIRFSRGLGSCFQQTVEVFSYIFDLTISLPFAFLDWANLFSRRSILVTSSDAIGTACALEPPHS